MCHTISIDKDNNKNKYDHQLMPWLSLKIFATLYWILAIVMMTMTLTLLVNTIFKYRVAADESSDAICKRLQSAPNSGKMHILCVAKLRRRLVVITNDPQHYVYDLPLTSLSSTINRLYLGDAKPVPIKQKWPVFTASRHYKTVVDGGYVYNSFGAIDSNSEYIFITSKNNNVPKKDGTYDGPTYDVDRQKTIDGFTYYGSDDQVLVSSNFLKHFYAINKQGGHTLKMVRFHFTGSSVINSDGIDPDVRGFYPMCAVGTDRVAVHKVLNGRCEDKGWKALNWPVMTGFVDSSDDKFYLFGTNYIFVFPNVYEKPTDQGVVFKRIDYGNFIQCKANVDPRSLPQKAPNNLAVIVSVVLLILLLLLCCLLLLIQQIIRKRKKQEKEEKKSSKSLRSGGMKGAGDLSKKGTGDGKSLRSNQSARSNGSMSGAGSLKRHGGKKVKSGGSNGSHRSLLGTHSGKALGLSEKSSGKSKSSKKSKKSGRSGRSDLVTGRSGLSKK